MATRKQQDDSAQEAPADVTQTAADAPGGVDERQVEAGTDPVDRLVVTADRDLHPSGEPAKQADRTSYPVPNDADLEDPPVRTVRPDTPGISRLATGAGKHEPPDPGEFTAEGRPR